ncbi:MAG: c-type cytochrome [Burkholderiales bacterium]
MRIRAAWMLMGACCVAASAAPAIAADTATGRQKAAACAVCHGPLGLSVTPDAPNLAGQPAMYVAEQLKAYRSGKREHEVMTLMAKPLSDADIDHLAAWFASLKIQVQAPS